MNVVVIVPVYNVAPYLKRCVDSLLSQTYRDFSLILVDDGSTDGSGARCDDYAAHDARIRVLHQPNGGLSAARNAALDLLARENTATHVTFVDSDDWVAPTYLEELVRGLSLGADIAAVRFLRTADGNMTWNLERPVDWQMVSPRAFWILPENNPAAACGKLYARRLFLDVRYPVGKINEDEYTTYRIFFKTDAIACASVPLYAYYVRPNSITNAAWSPRRLDRLQAWREQIAFFGARGYDELVANSRKGLTLDLVDAIRNLAKIQDRDRAKALRNELAEHVRMGRLDIRDNYLAHKTAFPLRTKLLKGLGRC